MSSYDVIVVGARCAGAATAMLLAREGHRVLLADRARFPSDTVSTHLIHAPGVAALKRWGLLDALIATGCPPITTYTFDFGPFTLRGTPPPSDGAHAAYCPRRIVLDSLLVEAAARAGAEVREGFTVRDLVVDGDRVVGVRGGETSAPTTERATVVVGADGAQSRVARAVAAPAYRCLPIGSVAYYSYWSGFETDAASWAIRPGTGFGTYPTHDGLTILLVAWPYAARARLKQDLEGSYLRALRERYGDRLDGARREERVVGGSVANHFRRPFGSGWALVGDAGYLLDPVTAQGMTDAFLDAELCAGAIHAALTGSADAMTGYQRRRDARVSAMYEFTAGLATLQPPPPELGRALAGMAGDRQAMDAFAGVVAGTVAPAAVLGPPPAPARPAQD